ncbi:hypothetical protein BDV18DRAFT_137318 [Aspergillus unguis]
MSATPRKPGSPANANKASATDQSTTGTPSRGHTRSPTTTSNGLSRSPSLRGSTPVSARAAARKPGRSNLSMSSVPKLAADPSEEEARAQNAALIEDLKEQLHKAETASDQYQKQLGVLQMRLDEAVSEQAKLEDLGHERDSKVEALNGEIREHVRQIRDLEQAHELERNAMLQDKEQQASREEEMQATIQRLKEAVAQKDMRIGADGDKNVSRSSSFRNRASPDIDGQFAPSSQIERSPSRNNSTLLLQKDKLIESLRLELAESQIKLVEMENKGGGRQRELEKELLEARMANARLMEDNESYQLLLSERTLNGDFAKGDFMREAHPDTDTKESGGGLGSLADELESADSRPEPDDSRRLESELKALKDQNKALTLYIERIISRLLQHEGFEHILDKNDNEPPAGKQSGSDKDLPPTPPEKDDPNQQTFLQRARSVVSGQQNKPQPRSRPSSMMPPPPAPSAIHAVNAHENPTTAPSIPINRAQSMRGGGHRRTRSEQTTDLGAAAVVGQMYRGRNSGGPMSPPIMGPGSRNTFTGPNYAPGSMSVSSRAPSLSSQPERGHLSSSGSVSSDPPGDTASTGATSNSPRSSNGMTNYTGAVMTQSKLRPLRLVSESKAAAEDEEAARKKANRGSWISWFNRPGSSEAQQP